MFGVNFDFQGSKVKTKAHSSIRLLCCRDLQSCSCCRKLNCGKQGFIWVEEKYFIKDNLLKGPGRNLARVSLVQTGIWELDATQPECESRTRTQALGEGPGRQVEALGRGEMEWDAPSWAVMRGRSCQAGKSSADFQLPVLVQAFQARWKFGPAFWEVCIRKAVWETSTSHSYTEKRKNIQMKEKCIPTRGRHTDISEVSSLYCMSEKSIELRNVEWPTKTMTNFQLTWRSIVLWTYFTHMWGIFHISVMQMISVYVTDDCNHYSERGSHYFYYNLSDVLEVN